MSNFVINRHGTDQVSIQLMSQGSSEASVNLQNEILDARLKYVFAVDHLNVPLNACPINRVKNEELFRVIRRNVGLPLLDVNTTFVGTVLAATQNVYTVTRPFFDVTSFVRDLNNFCIKFELSVTLTGIIDFTGFGGPAGGVAPGIVPPVQNMPAKDQALIDAEGTYDLIRFKMNIDGSLSVQMHSNFTNNFVLQFTRLGAELLGLSNHVKAIEIPVIGNQYFIAVTTTAAAHVSTSEAWVDIANVNTILVGGNLRDVVLYGEHSLYQVADQRVMVSIESHLPMLGNVLVRDGKETVDRNILEAFFDQQIKSTMRFDKEGAFVEQSITNTVYAGQFPFVRKDQPSKQWHRLLTALDLRFMRFYLFITYRSYSSEKDEWTTKPYRVDVPKNNYWDFSLRFLSEV